MARLALNFLFDPEQYPVDLSEVFALESETRLMAEAFFNNCAMYPGEYASCHKEEAIAHELIKIVSAPVESSTPKAISYSIHTTRHVYDFLRHFRMADRNKLLMARIAMNALGYAERYPVDASELRFLAEENRPAVLAFLAYAARSKPLPEDAAILGNFKASAETRLAWRGVKLFRSNRDSRREQSV